jgi:tetratricopeptide (TPR) repeat protein
MSIAGISANTPLPAERLAELERTCFVIMPFGEKPVGDRKVDFNAIYQAIFKPAIEAVKTPEGHPLLPARTDMDGFSGAITQEMFEYILYSRMAFADISGFNPNVLYEIGVRHSAQESGTVLFRQAGGAIPFDIATIKVFEYEYELDGNAAAAARERIASVLGETLRRNRLDSPVRLALRAQWGGRDAPPQSAVLRELPQDGPHRATNPAGPDIATSTAPVAPLAAADIWRRQAVEQFMSDAEESLRFGDLDGARLHLWGALRFDPANLIARMRLGLILKRLGRHHEALDEFSTVTRLSPSYAEAWKEKGIAEGRLARLIPVDKRPKWLQDGLGSLERACRLNPDDFDAWSSLGGVYKNVRGESTAALRAYQKSAEISESHPYPLLNAMKLRAQQARRLDLDSSEAKASLAKALRLRAGQASAQPAADAPWCFFDLAEISLYQRRHDDFASYLKQGAAAAGSRDELETFRSSLAALKSAGIEFDGLDSGLELLGRLTEEFGTPA